jgi:GTP cyclohydrolase I
MRGVRNDAMMTSAAFRGVYEKKEERQEIIEMIRKRSSDFVSKIS